MSDLIITPLPAFKDNYMWLLTRGSEAAIVDPGDAEPVIRALEQQQLRLTAILATHHHADHVGGLVALKQRYPATAYGPARENVAQLDHRLTAGDKIEVLGTRSEERRVGKECMVQCRSRWSPYH